MGDVRTYMVNVRGKQHEWGFKAQGTAEDKAEWEADGFQVWEVVNTVPDWLPARLTSLRCRLQDIWNWPSKWGRE